MATVQQKCCVFIDNSNLFIEGQKFYARRKKLRASVPQDIRFRIDMGRMLLALLQGREKIYAKLYGSEPPAVDSLWQGIRSKGILVSTFERNAKDYEKEVDTSLAVDVTAQSFGLQEPTGSVTFIIIGGDRDYLPAYDKVLERNWKLEIAAWKNCLAQKVKKFAQDNRSKGVSLIMLDDLAASNPSIYFLEDRWTAHKRLPRDRTIVFEYRKPVEDREAKQLNSDVTDLIQFPCWYLHRPEKDAKIVMIIIITGQEEGKYSTDALYERIKAKFAERCVKIVDFVKYKQEQNPTWLNNDVLFKYKDFEEEEEEESKLCQENEARAEDESGDGEFKVVEPKRHKSKQKFSEQCIYRFVCRLGKSCRYAHTDAEKEHFKNHPQMLGRLYKAKFCFHAENNRCQYQRNPKQCCYAHGESEARCYNCDPGGLEGVHWMDQCPNKES